MTSTTRTRLGYLRVSTGKQDERLQHDALDGAKVLKRNRYVDHGVSGTKTEREGLTALLTDAYAEREAGHEVTIVVYRLDRLGRSTLHIAQLLADLTDRGICIESIADGLDSSTPMGRAMLQMASIFAEMERNIIAERTIAGLAAARAKGRKGGRPRVADSATARRAQTLRNDGDSVPDIAKTLGISIATVYRLTKAPAAK